MRDGIPATDPGALRERLLRQGGRLARRGGLRAPALGRLDRIAYAAGPARSFARDRARIEGGFDRVLYGLAPVGDS
ncbi:MAG: hypothetical protein AB1761_17400 [Pseudomonadota bacterium]